MPKSFWKGVINFGLVAIPVRMYVATQARTPNFHLLHRKCLTRPKQVHYCEKDNEYFNLRDTTRGYEYSRNQFVVLSESDFDKVSIKTTRAIDISTFVDANAIDPIYFYGSHYVAPEDLGLKPFNLFREALRKSNRMAIAKVVFQKREHLCSLRPQ
jgi:DNA end-binding protein Ku